MKVTLRSYIIGLALSLGCTVAAFGLVHTYLSAEHHVLSHQFLIGILTVLALVQLISQLIFFLHVGSASNPWNTLALVCTLLIAVFVVAGSLWIMTHLQHNSGIPFSESVTPQHEMR